MERKKIDQWIEQAKKGELNLSFAEIAEAMQSAKPENGIHELMSKSCDLQFLNLTNLVTISQNKYEFEQTQIQFAKFLNTHCGVSEAIDKKANEYYNNLCHQLDNRIKIVKLQTNN